MKKNSKESLDRKHISWKRLFFLQKRIGELERVKMPTMRQKRLLKRYRLEFTKLFVIIT